MKFFTEVDIPKPSWAMVYQTGTMLMGSCFTENIGNKLDELKFPVDINPFGIVYNPVSVANGLRLLMENKPFTTEDLFFDQGVWNSFSHHSRFSGVDAEMVIEGINQRLESSSVFLKNARFLIITFGTAWVYEHLEKGQVVSNCHKVPAKEFKRYRLTTDEIVADYRELRNELMKFNPDLKVIFTVSPIRHWKDGAIENQLSKATLLLAIDQMVEEFSSDYFYYFPSYELVMDELRDYRYYASDMLHLSEVAVDYIWEKFRNRFISEESIQLSGEVSKIQKAVQHRPFNPASEEYRKFLLYNLDQIVELTGNFPFLNFQNEKKQFQEKLKQLGEG